MSISMIISMTPLSPKCVQLPSVIAAVISLSPTAAGKVSVLLTCEPAHDDNMGYLFDAVLTSSVSLPCKLLLY